MLVEAPVLGRQRRPDHEVGDFGQRHGIVGPDAATPDLIAVAVEKDHRVILGPVELPRRRRIHGRKRQRDHQHRSHRPEAEGIGRNFDKETADTAHGKQRKEVLDLGIDPARRPHAVVKERIQPCVGLEQTVLALGALLFCVKRILHRGAFGFDGMNAAIGRARSRTAHIVLLTETAGHHNFV